MINKIIAMWSGPRNLSTALMRSFANREDVNHVLDEPFYGAYLTQTNKNHPMRDEVIQSQRSKPCKFVFSHFNTNSDIFFVI